MEGITFAYSTNPLVPTTNRSNNRSYVPQDALGKEIFGEFKRTRSYYGFNSEKTRA